MAVDAQVWALAFGATQVSRSANASIVWTHLNFGFTTLSFI